jgi:hypothetical protein
MKRYAMVLAGILWAWFGAAAAGGQESGPYALQIRPQAGQKLSYKNLYRMIFTTDRAKELGASTGGASLVIETNWEWIQEESSKAEEKESVVTTSLTKASNSTRINGQNVTVDYYPWSLEDLRGMEFSWKVDPQGKVSAFGVTREVQRLNLATVAADLRLIAEFGWYPWLSAEPKAVGGSWTVERKASSIYEEFQNFDAAITLNSTCKIKGIVKKGTRTCLEISEEGPLAYRRWQNTGVTSLILEGDGKAKSTWLLDTADGTVVESKVRLDIEPRPTVVGESSQRNIETRVTIWVERRLEK